MTYRAIFNTNTGRLVSIASVWGRLSADLDYIEMDEAPDLATQMWDETGRRFVARPPKVRVDRLTDITSGSEFTNFRREVYNGLSASQQDEFEKMLNVLLGTARYRNETEPVKVDNTASGISASIGG
jgi:hypothetical protein